MCTYEMGRGIIIFLGRPVLGTEGGVSFFGSLSNFRAWNCPKNDFDFFRGSLIRRNATAEENFFYPNQAENLLPPTPFSGGTMVQTQTTKKPSSLYPPTPSSGRVQMLPSSPIYPGLGRPPTFNILTGGGFWHISKMRGVTASQVLAFGGGSSAHFIRGQWRNGSARKIDGKIKIPILLSAFPSLSYIFILPEFFLLFCGKGWRYWYSTHLTPKNWR